MVRISMKVMCWSALFSMLVCAKNQKKMKNTATRSSGTITSIHRGECPLTQGASLEALIKEGSRNFGSNYPVAEDCYKRAIQSYPNSALAIYNYGLTQLNQGNAKASEKSFERAIKLDPTYGEAYFGLGTALYDRGGSFIPDARKALLFAVKLSPRMYAAYNQLGNVYLAQEKIPEAMKSYQTVVQLSPRSAEGYANLGRVFAAVGRRDDAFKSLMNAVGLAPVNPQLYYELGMIAKNAQSEGAARRFFSTAIRLLPSHAAAHYQVIDIFFSVVSAHFVSYLDKQLGELKAGTVFSDDRCI